MFTAADILAGPILRRVELDLVSVWIALTTAAEVQLEIYHGVGESGNLGPAIPMKPHAGENKRDHQTLAAGKGLHLAVAVWEPASVGGLEWGGLYSYDVKITSKGGGTVGLKDLGLLSDSTIRAHDIDHAHLAFGYQKNWLPSFALPPANLRDLKMIQGSCRGTNGHGRDAMAAIDDLLRNLIADPKQRPHQMHLTGDQIYADEGAPELVEIISNVTGEWLGNQAGACFEKLHIEFPKTDTEDAIAFDVPVDIAHLPPSKRSHLMIEVAHFTSDHADSHAMSFGEYCGTYLTGWCNVPWIWKPKDRMADAKARFAQYLDDTQKLHAKASIPFKLDVLGLSGENEQRKAVDEMIRYFCAWKLIPAIYRKIDEQLTRDDVAAAWGKGNPNDGPRFDLWNNFASAISLPEILPLETGKVLGSPPTDDMGKKMNRLARALTPSWFAGSDEFGDNPLFRVEYDVQRSDADPSKPGFKIKGSAEFNRIHRLDWCYQDLPKIRRILANIPTYMVFDDHEVTDDWNISYKWQKLSRRNSLGRGVIRNALAAFTLFQYWGNDPRACRPGKFASLVLDNIEKMFANATTDNPGPDPDAAKWLEQAFDLSLLPDTPPPGSTKVSDPSQRMRWDFRYDGPQFEVLALDSRTWRGAEIDANDLLREPFYDDATATLMTDQAIRLQVPEQPGPSINPNGVSIVIAAAPFLGFPLVESVAQPLINLRDMIEREPEFPFKRWKRSLLFGRVAHDPEPWGFRPATFEAMLARLNSRNRVIFFSGDVHYSFSSHMNYWQIDPATGLAKTASRFVQLTASSFRAQQPTVASVFALDILQQLGGLASKTRRQGWHRGPAGSETFGPPIQAISTPFNQHITQSLLDDPILISPDAIPHGTRYLRKPEWLWEMEIDGDLRSDTERFATTPPPNFSNASHLEIVQSVARRHAWAARYSMARKWFWWTNFTFVGFQPDSNGDASKVVFQVYSFDPDGHEPAAQPFLTALIDLTVKPQPDADLVEA
jgi:hypothetical protein